MDENPDDFPGHTPDPLPPMLREQNANPIVGPLSVRPIFGLRNNGVLQHWRSTEHLHAYACQGGTHLAAWERSHEKIGTDDDVDIWHETDVAPIGHAESIYVNMPRYGMGIVGDLPPAKGACASARKWLAGKGARGFSG